MNYIYISENNNLKLADTYIDLKDLFTIKADYNQAKKLVYKALELYEALENDEGIARSYAHIGDLLYYENNFHELL